MNDASATIANEKELVAAARSKVTVFDIFLQFLIIGATSFGGVVPYLREGLITKNHCRYVRNLSSCSPSVRACRA